MVAKDIAYFGDPYIMRGSAQGLCLLVGGIAVLSRIDSVLTRYWPILGYLFVILVSASVAAQPTYVLLQVISLGAVLLFFIAYFETERVRGYQSELFMQSTVGAYAAIMVLSLVAAWALPQFAYEVLPGNEVRFRGLFAKSGMLGTAAGVMIGIAWFGFKRWWSRLIFIVPAIFCLAWTLSRTFWVALLVAWAVTAWRLKPQSRKWVVGALLVGSFVVAVAGVLNVQIDEKAADKMLRTGTITNLSGRVTLWASGFEAIKRSPLLGYGFTAGSDGLKGDGSDLAGRDDSSINDARSHGRVTVHSGYLQSMLDSGVLGSFFYLAAMFLAVLRLWQRGNEERFAPHLFALLFLLIANVTENVVYSAAVYSSLLFWGIAIFALSLPSARSRTRSVAKDHDG